MWQAEFHVRLAGADPDFTDKDVFEIDGIITFDLDRVGPAGFWDFEKYFPLTVFVGCDRFEGILSLGSLLFHHFTQVSSALESRIALLLKNRVVRQHRRQFYLGLQIEG